MLARRLALAIAVLAGLIGSQGPEFAQQYRQRLGGALEELNRIVSEFDAEAQRQNLTRAEGLKRLEDDADPLARERGEDMGKAIDRAERLNDQIRAMNSAGPLMRLYVAATSFDPEIARSTLDNYEPAEPLSLGALIAGGLAALWGWAATRLIAWPFSRRSRLAPPALKIADGGRRDRPERWVGLRLSWIQVNWIIEGLAAIIAGVRPATVRLSPCVSEIVSADWPLTPPLVSTAVRSSASVMAGVR